MLEAGFAKTDLTVYEHGQLMLGWAHHANVSTGVAAPLFARAAVISGPPGLAGSESRIAFVCVDLCLTTHTLRRGVIERLSRDHPELGLGEHNVMLTANHTHSGPSGYSHEFAFSVLTPFSPRVYEHLVSAVVAAIAGAAAGRAPTVARLVRGQLPLHEPIAFNRAWEAYNANEDVEPVTEARRDEAVDRTMTCLCFSDPRGVPQGCLSWFAVHGTSIHADSQRLHPDNKGIAADHMEAGFRARNPRFVAIFAQGAAGDVSPNFRFDQRRGLMVGRFDDDFASAALVGETQSRFARRLYEERGEDCDGPLRAALRYVDFAEVAVDPADARGEQGARTGSCQLGMGFGHGTREGPGPLHRIQWFNAGLMKLMRARNAVRRGAERVGAPPFADADRHGEKAVLLHLGPGIERRVLGLFSVGSPVFAGWIDPALAYVKEQHRRGDLSAVAWIPSVLPLQILCVGPLAIVGMPCEPSTVAGRRLRAVLERALAPAGITAVVINGYANSHAEYLTTWEEYQLQGYEGSATLFGQWQLGAFQTEYRKLAGDLLEGRYRPEQAACPAQPFLVPGTGPGAAGARARSRPHLLSRLIRARP